MNIAETKEEAKKIQIAYAALFNYYPVVDRVFNNSALSSIKNM